MEQPFADPGPIDDFRWRVRIYYEDTDAGGIVYYANYLKFLERARTEWLRRCGIDQRRLAEQTGMVFIVRSLEMDYRCPARLDDTIEIRTRVIRLGRASVVFSQQAWRGESMLVAGSVCVACVMQSSLRPGPIPPTVLAALRRGPVNSVPQATDAPGHSAH
jgi:acyl-CoA thioester hydrolase